MEKSICFGIISNGLMHIETTACLMQAAKALEVPSTLVIITGCYLHRNRNEMIEKAISTGATHVLSLDTDMVFHPDAVSRLLAHDKDIVGVNYNKRQFPITPIVKGGLEDNLFQTEFVPGGFFLVKLSIFKDLSKPWFFYDEQAQDDDKYFCHKAAAAGFEIWCDPTIKVGHIGNTIY